MFSQFAPFWHRNLSQHSRQDSRKPPIAIVVVHHPAPTDHQLQDIQAAIESTDIDTHNNLRSPYVTATPPLPMLATQSPTNQPAFRGASFSSTGTCVHHPDVKLSNKITVNGRTVYQELRKVCPKCEKDPPISKMNSITSLNRSAHSGVSNGTGVTGGSASTKSRKSEGTSTSRRSESRGKPSPQSFSARSSTPGRGRSSQERRPSNQTTESRPESRARSSSRSRAGSRPRGRSDEEESKGTTRSKSKDRRRAPSRGPRKEYETPFDSKGRCHYHVHVQLAKKKMMGGWNVSCSLQLCTTELMFNACSCTD